MAKRDKIAKFWPKIIKMASIEERLTTVLEAVVALQNTTRQIPPQKEVSYIPEFTGDPKQLTQFLSIVDTHLGETPANRKPSVWTSIRNLKISGKAKELLLNNTVTTWEEAKQLFTQHFRPTINLKDVIRKINGLKVSSILELHNKVEFLIGEINSYSVYETNRNDVKNMLYQTLIVKIKELATGNLARELKSVFDLHQTKEILFTYIGFDDNIENRYNPHNPKPNIPKHKPNPSVQPFNSSDQQRNPHHNSERFRQHPSHFERFRNTSNQNRPFNPSGQFRNATQNPQPMEIDNIHQEETNNNIEEQVFLN